MNKSAPLILGAGVVALFLAAATRRGSSSAQMSGRTILSKMAWTPQSSTLARSMLQKRVSEISGLDFSSNEFKQVRFEIVRDVVVSLFGDFAPTDAAWPTSIHDFDVDEGSFVMLPRWVEENPIYGGSMYALWLKVQELFNDMTGVAQLPEMEVA